MLLLLTKHLLNTRRSGDVLHVRNEETDATSDGLCFLSAFRYCSFLFLSSEVYRATNQKTAALKSVLLIYQSVKTFYYTD